MKTEIEAKILQIDPKEVRKQLAAIGATCKQPMQLMRRVIFSTPEMSKKESFVRVRDEGYRIAVTYKQYLSQDFSGAREIEFTASSYDDAVAFMEAVGIKVQSAQEARREIWLLDDVEIVIDEWPWIQPYLEVEGPNEARVQEVVEQLGFEWSQAKFGDIMTAYRHEYPNTGETASDMVYNLPSVRFEDVPPAILKV